MLVGGLAFAQLSSNERAEPAATPSATATTAGPRSTAPVEMAAPALAERPATVCRALLSQLPATVNDLPQRPVTAGPEQNAAYGDPAVTVACGGAEPTVGETDDVWTVNRVCWHATEQADATVLTTLDRETAVTVRVPRSYGPALQWVSPSRTPSWPRCPPAPPRAAARADPAPAPPPAASGVGKRSGRGPSCTSGVRKGPSPAIQLSAGRCRGAGRCG